MAERRVQQNELLLATSKRDSKQGTQAKFLFREGQLHVVFIELCLF